MQTHGVEVRSIRTLRGPNLFCHEPLLRIAMDIGLQLGYGTYPKRIADEYVLHDLADLGGRAPGEVAGLLQRNLPVGVSAVGASQEEAIRRAWQRLHRGDRLVVIVDEADRTIRSGQELADSVSSEDGACIAPLSADLKSQPQSAAAG